MMMMMIIMIIIIITVVHMKLPLSTKWLNHNHHETTIMEQSIAHMSQLTAHYHYNQHSEYATTMK